MAFLGQVGVVMPEDEDDDDGTRSPLRCVQFFDSEDGTFVQARICFSQLRAATQAEITASAENEQAFYDNDEEQQ